MAAQSALLTGRRLPVGAECTPGGVSFRVWAPNCKAVEVVLDSDTGSGPQLQLASESNGYFSGIFEGITNGARYWFKLDDDPKLYPDPVSRYQPSGAHGSSEVIDGSLFKWTDQEWKGTGIKDQVFYEMHIGTFTSEGTYAAAQRELAELKRIGITTLEVMPVAEFAGQFGWGYDGVNLYAPTRLYGRPDDLRSFIDHAHSLGLGVILDVVYNHFGADGNYAPRFSKDYFSSNYDNEWGDAINFDGADSGPVREFFIENAGYWVDEFHFDGLRLDATQQIYDKSPTNVMQQICDRVRVAAAGRETVVVGENEPQDVKLLASPAEGGYGLDCLWNDDFHHTAKVAMTGKCEAYFIDYLGTSQELLSAVKYGYLYQGQYSRWNNANRGTSSLHIEPARLINFIQNHDQIANSGKGLRADKLTSMGRYKAMTALMLLAPGSPMFFQGQEFASSAPFTYFADHEPHLAEQVTIGRKKSLANFRSMNNEHMLNAMALPHDRKTFDSCKLDFSEREKHGESYALTQELLRLRKDDPTFSKQSKGTCDGAIVNPEAFIVRFFGATPQEDRLLLVNMGRDLDLIPCTEPLIAPPKGCTWNYVLSTEDPKFGGLGAPPAYENSRLYMTAHSAVVLAPIAL